eukprot:TRINITY_DN6129_c0_g1_i1.p1 TRINITY_DN6129_c0_g1~~TRINITY_DN6129_c0_g1_i1.p1  ORF type:complete len:2300 (+),score=375.38 TRINITY_DN6129_c0_g1_i1:7-6906(+)
MSVLDLKEINEEIQLIFGSLFNTKDSGDIETYMDMLHDFVSVQYKLLKGEKFIIVLSAVDDQLEELFNDENPLHVLIGIKALDTILGVEHDIHDGPFIFKWMDYLSIALKMHDDISLVKAACACFGRYAQYYKSILNRNIISGKFMDALGSIQSPCHASKRLADILFINEMLNQLPKMLDLQVFNTEEFVDTIKTLICDVNPNIRSNIIKMIEHISSILSERLSSNSYFFTTLISFAMTGLKNKAIEYIQGSVLVICVLLKSNRELMSDYFIKVSNLILNHRQHKNQIIRVEVLNALPIMAEYDPDLFCSHFFERVVEHYSNFIKKDTEATLLSIGKLSLVLKDSPTDIIRKIIQALQIKKPWHSEKYFECLVNLAEAFDSRIERFMYHTLKSLFETDFTEMLIATIVQISNYIPGFEERMIERISDHISEIVAPVDETSKTDYQQIILGLDCLSKFSFSSDFLIELISRTVVTYLRCHVREIRRVAALTLSKLLKKNRLERSNNVKNVLFLLFNELMRTALTEQDIRIEILGSLGHQYDLYLSHPDILNMILLFLYDTDIEVQLLTIKLCGRISEYSSAYVYPAIRKLFTENLKGVELHVSIRKKEACSQILSTIIKKVPNIVVPYARTTIEKILQISKTSSSSILVVHAMISLGDMAMVDKELVLEYIDQILEIIVVNLEDQSASIIRSVALTTLGDLVKNTNFVIKPFMKFPTLLDTLIKKLNEIEETYAKRKIIRVIGIIGAIEPYKYLKKKINTFDNGKIKVQPNVVNNWESIIMRSVTYTSDDYYHRLALLQILKILQNPYGYLVYVQLDVIEAISEILISLEMECVQFIDLIFPPLLVVMDVCGDIIPRLRATVFIKLSEIVKHVKYNVKQHIEHFKEIIYRNWNHSEIQKDIITLIEYLAISLKEEFSAYLGLFLPMLIAEFGKPITVQILRSFKYFGYSLEKYLYIVIPEIIELLHNGDHSILIQCLRTLSQFSNLFDLSSYSMIIFQNLIVLLNSTTERSLELEILETLGHLIVCVEKKSFVFIETVKSIMQAKSIGNNRFLDICKCVDQKNGFGYEKRTSTFIFPTLELETEKDVFVPDYNEILNALNPSFCSLPSDWIEWKRKLNEVLLQESPSVPLRACSTLAKSHYPTAKDLFNASFISLWKSCDDALQEVISGHLKEIIESSGIPPDVLHELLDLFEYMEHNEVNIPVDIGTLAAVAKKTKAFAKALHFKETQFKRGEQVKAIDDLIVLNDKLGFYQSGHGILMYSMGTLKLPIQSTWYVKLQRWIEFLQLHEDERDFDFESNEDLMLGKISSLTNLGEYLPVKEITIRLFERYGNNISNKMSVKLRKYQLNSLLHLMEWEELGKAAQKLDPSYYESKFYRSIYSIYINDFKGAKRLISECRDLSAQSLASTIGQNYNRAYKTIVKFQQLTELEEVIEYFQSNEEQKKVIIDRWDSRLVGIEGSVKTWMSVLAVRSIVLPPDLTCQYYLKLAQVSFNNDRPRLSRRILSNMLVGYDNVINPGDVIPDTLPTIKYTYLKVLYKDQKINRMEEAMDNMGEFIESLTEINYDPKFISRCCSKLAKWLLFYYEPMNEETISYVLKISERSVDLGDNWYKSWHRWGIANFRVITHYAQFDPEKVDEYITPALQGFTEAIALSPRDLGIRDTLRFLTLWFSYGNRENCVSEVYKSIGKLPIDIWLYVLPQIIARMHIPVSSISQPIKQILFEIGKIHPQGLVFPIVASLKSSLPQSVVVAREVLDNMREHDDKLVRDTEVLAKELIHLSTLLDEKVLQILLEGTRLCSKNDLEGLFKLIEPLHRDLVVNKKYHTKHEAEFTNLVIKDFMKIYSLLRKTFPRPSVIKTVEDLLTSLIKLITKKFNFKKLNIKNSSPVLFSLKDTSVAIPGTYIDNYSKNIETVTIKSFRSTFKIIKESKNKPRKVGFDGSDGVSYRFLLKGNEDLRQDERVMQLFILLNSLLKSNNSYSRMHYKIERYNVIPLSSLSGLVQWVPNSETLHSQILNYRKNHDINDYAEQIVMADIVEKNLYHQLTIFGKLEAFNYILDNTSGNDLERAFWLSSVNSEEWIDKRITFIRSTAMMSMIGYILGLGDRHPNNIMINKYTGGVVHVDFGDCFEVASNREYLPELVPFRLTRMMINAMEVSGVNGSFRATCEDVVQLLRANKESIMAVLESFVYDPLINWRLFTENEIEELGTDETPIDEEMTPSLRSKKLDQEILSNLIDNETGSNSTFANKIALNVLARISRKLKGNDFDPEKNLNVKTQVDLLINEATSNLNLCQSYLGWCPYW